MKEKRGKRVAQKIFSSFFFLLFPSLSLFFSHFFLSSSLSLTTELSTMLSSYEKFCRRAFRRQNFHCWQTYVMITITRSAPDISFLCFFSLPLLPLLPLFLFDLRHFLHAVVCERAKSLIFARAFVPKIEMEERTSKGERVAKLHIYGHISQLVMGVFP